MRLIHGTVSAGGIGVGCSVLFGVLVSGGGSAWAGQVDVQGVALAAGRAVANAVVWIDAPGAPRSRSHERVVLDQRNMTFVPHVLAVRTGTTIDFPNNDRVFHNVFSYRDGRRFDLGLYPVGATRKVTFQKAGLSRIFCSIHPHMSAYVISVDTDYHGVSDAKGRFTLAAVPSGTYTFHAWRPGGAEIQGSMVVRPDTPVEVRWPS